MEFVVRQRQGSPQGPTSLRDGKSKKSAEGRQRKQLLLLSIEAVSDALISLQNNEKRNKESNQKNRRRIRFGPDGDDGEIFSDFFSLFSPFPRREFGNCQAKLCRNGKLLSNFPRFAFPGVSFALRRLLCSCRSLMIHFYGVATLPPTFYYRIRAILSLGGSVVSLPGIVVDKALSPISHLINHGPINELGWSACISDSLTSNGGKSK